MISLPVWISSLLFALIHSLFASARCKTLFYQLGLTSHRYRLLYSLFAVALTALWLLYIYQLPDRALYQIDGWLKWLMILIQLCGAYVVLVSLKSFDAGGFLGISEMPREGEPFHEHGIYRYLRHPMYTGVMLVLLASPVQSVISLNLTMCISIYFIIGARFEEQRMLKAQPHYAGYRKRVPAFLPWRALFHRRRGPQ